MILLFRRDGNGDCHARATKVTAFPQNEGQIVIVDADSTANAEPTRIRIRYYQKGIADCLLVTLQTSR